ncbi:hypothetical protein BJY16_006526 [Actinoplanes octamycinicus]|uniref:Uncharacterized protein n=1 Tax=Actinoplanes octamycinicus TaxID=135948 RepID=A0A7W7H373_9ACTN|nr:hypothetical protein [Actinoplanes octamycinicus]MBB4743067.1 hypothetical protein [Actinoplanes octamycinicus]GIE61369.1 hypothetical protein Aoc01nite_67710 [Actinoplanes octamycinicus]
MADAVARRQAELQARVGERLAPGETYRAALWVARPSGLPLISKIAGGVPGPLTGSPPGPGSGLAAELYQRLPEYTSAAALALTDARLLLLLLAETARPRPRRLFSRAEPDVLPALTLAWECPRAAVDAAAASDPEGRLALRFTDGSTVSLVAPAVLAIPFAEAAKL